MFLTIAMWAHVFLNAIVCYERTRNPIWGELRVVLVVAATVVVWMMVALTVPAPLAG